MAGEPEIRNLEKWDTKWVASFVFGFSSRFKEKVLRLQVSVDEVPLSEELESSRCTKELELGS
jgi:hypothetical protein